MYNCAPLGNKKGLGCQRKLEFNFCIAKYINIRMKIKSWRLQIAHESKVT